MRVGRGGAPTASNKSGARASSPRASGIADINGISKAVLRAFSTRRAEIEAEMASRGVTSARAAEVAALDTRQAKD